MTYENLRLSRTYAYSAKAPLACPITVFCGERDALVSQEALHAWAPYTRNTFTRRTIPGSHFFINSERAQVLDNVTQTLRPHLPQALSTSGHSRSEEIGP